jgi:hypothetical protein
MLTVNIPWLMAFEALVIGWFWLLWEWVKYQISQYRERRAKLRRSLGGHRIRIYPRIKDAGPR